MDTSTLESLPPPPGVIGSLRAGFDAVASHATALALPFALDLFLWLGPRLSLEKFYLSSLPQLMEGWRLLGFSAEEINRMVEQNADILPQLNLFLLLRAFPIGVSSLLFSRSVSVGIMDPTFLGRVPQTPFGISSVIQATSESNLIGWVFWLVLIGWLIGAFYFRGVARLVTTMDEQRHLASTGRAIGQSILLSIVWSWAILAISRPLSFLLNALLQNPNFALITILLFGFFSMWAIVPLYFWPYGIFLKKQNVMMSLFNGWRMARFTLPASGMFVLSAFLLGIGLNFLWNVPPEDSWMMLAGIFGHAFVTTALLAASFIYYRDMTAWLEIALERFKTNATTRQA